MNNFILYLFSIIVTTSTSFFISIFFHFDFFVNLIEILIVFLKNSFLILTRFVSKILNNFSFSILTKSSCYFVVFTFFLNWIKKFWSRRIFALITFIWWCATWLFNFFTHASDTTNIFCQRVQKNVIVIFFFNNYWHFIVNANRASFNNLKTSWNFNRHQFAFARQ